MHNVLPLLWALLGILSYAFTQTRGFAYSNGDAPGGIAYVRDLESSGGDDGIVIAMGMVFGAVGTVWALVRRRRVFGVLDLVVNGLLVALQGLYLGAIDQGSVWVTIARGANIPLALWVGCLAALVGCIGAGTRAVGASLARRRTT